MNRDTRKLTLISLNGRAILVHATICPDGKTRVSLAEYQEIQTKLGIKPGECVGNWGG
jgi:hypothetical protein